MTASTMTAPSTYQHNMGAQVSEFGAPAQVFPFLNLPPELRNRIYYHIGEDFVASGSTPVEYHDLASSPVESVLPYLSLASVCRQIRYEFLPIFMKNQTIRVHIRHALALMSTLFPYESCHSNTLAGLTFRIEATLSKPDTSDFHMDADIRALLRLCLNAPAIQCNFTTSYATSPETSKTLEKLTNLFFQVERRDAWKSAITNDIARVVLSESNHERVRTVNLIMQPSFEKNWKIALPNGFGGVPGDDMWPFLERLGFEKKMKPGEGGIAVRVSRI